MLVLSFGRKGWQGKKDVGEDSEVEQRRRAKRERKETRMNFEC